nr:HD domain-containing phosphohydrolase [uncultured Acetobacterium sp.]
MTEAKAYRDIYNFSVKLNEVYQLFNDEHEDANEIFSLQFQKYTRFMINGLMNASFLDLEKYRNASCVSNCLPGHSIRTALLSICLAKELDIDKEEIYFIGLGGILHDIGKLFVPSKILHKPCKLSATEFDVVKKHASMGFELLEDVRWLPQESLLIVQSHHEKLDGSGYPNRLVGNEIHIFSRIVGVADVFDAITSKRNYREMVNYNEALEIIKRETPHLLDKNIVMGLIDLVESHIRSNGKHNENLNIGQGRAQAV